MATSKRILITGGCGFIGSNLAVYLSTAGHSVTAMDNLSRRGSEYLADRVRRHGGRVVHGDIRCPEDFDRVPEVDVLIDCSAEPSVLVGASGDEARYMLNVNLLGSLNCFEWARKHRCAVLFMSTSRVYPVEPFCRAHYQETETRLQYDDVIPGITGRGVSTACSLDGPRSLYGATKLAAELILQEYADAYDMPSVINRCGVVAGPWQLGKVDQGVFTYWLACHYFKKPLRYIGFGGSGKQVRDVLHIDDLCRLIDIQLQSIDKARAECYNAGGGLESSLSLLECTELCRTLTGHTVDIQGDAGNRPFDIPWYVTDNEQVSAAYDWTPRKSAKEVLADIYQWLEENQTVFSSLFNG